MVDKLIEELVGKLNEEYEAGSWDGIWYVDNFTIEKGNKISIKSKRCHHRLWDANCDT